MFWLAPHETPRFPQRGSPRMFRVAWIERYLSRVSPAQVVAVWVPVALFLLVSALRDPALGTGEVFLCLTSGVLAWTLLEYLLHRYVFHFEPREDSEFQHDLSFLIHGVHHDWPYHPDRLVMPPRWRSCSPSRWACRCGPCSAPGSSRVSSPAWWLGTSGMTSRITPFTT